MIESGVAKNEQVTEYKFTDKDGKLRREKIVKDNKTGKVVDHTLDGKKVEKQEENKQIQYNPGNGEFFLINRLDAVLEKLERVVKQLVEMNYYLVKGYGDDSDKERVEKLLND